MAQAACITMPEDLIDLRDSIEATWPDRIASLRAGRTPLALYDDLDDEQLRARARELGITVDDDADRATVEQAVAAKEKDTKPPWGDDEHFDAERAKKLIENLRGDRDKDRQRLAELEREKKQREDAAKTDEQRREEARQTAERERDEAKIEAARLRVALAKGLTETQAKRLVGETEEELAADADELLATFKPDGDDGQDPSLRRPTPRLRPGATPPSEQEETDPGKLAALVPRRY